MLYITDMSSFEIRNNTKGQGIYSLTHFDANQVLFKLNGQLIDKQIVDAMPINKAALVLQIGINKYLDLNGDKSFFINHSCNPNTMIKIISYNAFAVSIRSIKPQEEIMFDYSTTSTDTINEWSMSCKCNEWNCRKNISGFQYLSDLDKERYFKLGVVPKYIK